MILNEMNCHAFPQRPVLGVLMNGLGNEAPGCNRLALQSHDQGLHCDDLGLFVVLVLIHLGDGCLHQSRIGLLQA